MKKIFFILLILRGADPLFSQYTREGSVLGFHFGANYSPNNITDLPATIIPEIFSEDTYEITEKQEYGFTADVFVCRRFHHKLAVQGDFALSQQTGGYDYSDVEGLNYTLLFKYWYLTPSASIKLYPLGRVDENDENFLSGFYFRGGLQFGINLTPENISYKHEPEELYGPSEFVERELKVVLKGKNYLGWSGGLGWEHWFDSEWGLNFDARYYQNFGDVLQTEPNGYGFRDQTNLIKSLQLTVGAAFQF